jgi:hypothetical protein
VLLLGAAIVLIVALAARPEPVLAVGNLAVVLPIIACLVATVAGWIPSFPVWSIALAGLVFGETLAWNRHLIPLIVSEGQQYKGSLDAMRQPKTFWADNRRGTYLEPNVPMYELEPAMNGYDPPHIYKADGAFKGVMVPRGSHRVTFVFKPFLVFTSMLVSVLTLAGIAAALVLLLRKPRGIGPAIPMVCANTH